ncbi:MAG: efflux RND transporter permease subunit [Defluviitaleaceae bacterium]|nr:efflux RND transporter permease subunit [Defluviitaleaceae bacterium]
MGLTKIAVKRPVTTIMAILIVIAFGILSITNLNLDMMPNMDIPIAVVSTDYAGAGPFEMESLVTRPLEQVLGTVPGIRNITSISSRGNSLIVLEFEDGTNIDIAALDTRERIDMISAILPEGASRPLTLQLDINEMASLMIGISSDQHDLVGLKQLVDNRIVDRIERQEGVASVNVTGGRSMEIAVVLSSEQMRGHGVSEMQVIQTLMLENRNIPAGDVRQGDRTLQLRVTGDFRTLSEIEDILIPTPFGSVVALRDIATVEEVYREATSLSFINGVPSVTLSVQKQSTANTINVANAVLREFEQIKIDMPELEIMTIMNPAEFIEMTLAGVMGSAILGGVLAVIILYIFLRNVRLTLVVAAAMPISIIATFVLMYYANITINIMSLGGLALGLALLIDNSIVVLESIFRKIEEGCDRITSAIEGTREVAMPIVATTLTTVAVFLPITFGGGLTAQIFNQLALTVSFSLVSSLFVALTFVPMMSALLYKSDGMGKEKEKSGALSKIFAVLNKPFDFLSKCIEGLTAFYTRTLGFAITKRKTTLFAAIVFVFLTGLSMPFIGSEFLPQADESSVTINVSLPRGTLLAQTEAIVHSVLSRLDYYEEITDIIYTVGTTGQFGLAVGGGATDSAQIIVRLVGHNDRALSSAEIARDIANDLRGIAGAEFNVFATASAMGPMVGGGVEVSIFGNEIETLERLAREMSLVIAEIPGIRDVRTSVEESFPQASIQIDRARAASFGLSSATVSTIINTAVSGTVATWFRTGGTEYNVRVSQDMGRFDYITDIQSILIPLPTGAVIPLYEIADITIQDAPVSIWRENQQVVIQVSGSLDGISAGHAEAAMRSALSTIIMPSGYEWRLTGEAQQMNETFGGLQLALIMSILLIYMIMAAQFESLIYPFIVMFSIPIALTGGLVGLLVTGVTLNIVSYLGLIMVSGVVINNAIVLIDYTNLLIRERGMNVRDALMTAGPVRLRPILMTVLTTLLGLFPMAISTGQGAELMQGLAVTVISGLLFSTIVTLLLIPAIYIMIYDAKARIKAKFQ